MTRIGTRGRAAWLVMVAGLLAPTGCETLGGCADGVCGSNEPVSTEYAAEPPTIPTPPPATTVGQPGITPATR